MTSALATTIATPRWTLPDLRRMWTDAPELAIVALLLLLTLIPLYAAMALDIRVFQDESPWLKPVKFSYALGIYCWTLAFFARYLSPITRNGWRWRAFISLVVLAVMGEMAWLSYAAMLNTASHFNNTIPALIMMYRIAGVMAVILTLASLVMGILIWRNGATGLNPTMHLSVVLGLLLTFVATLIVAGYLSANGTDGGHFIGTSTRTLWLMGWSRDAGDLRVAHFFATHALHAVPLAGLLAARYLPAHLGRPAVVLAALGIAALVAGTFFQAVNGQPFLPWLG